METRLNIAEILKDKPKGTKLHSPLFGKCTFLNIYNSQIYISHHTDTVSSFYSNGTYFKFSEAEPLLFPSKEMCDWSKFAWKKGDVLISNNGKREVLFETWANDSYTKFIGYHSLITHSDEEVEYDNSRFVFNTNDFIGIEAEEAAKTYINTIEKHLGGKLNRETLKIEKTQPEFKEWDFITIKLPRERPLICVFKAEDGEKYYLHANLDIRGIITIEGSYCNKSTCTARLSTEEEKTAFFDALAKKGKTWDAVKKQIEDSKSKVVFKPFDRVLVRDCLDEMWRPSFFACYLPFGREPYQVIGGEWVKLCIPYEGNESLLGTTKNVKG